MTGVVGAENQFFNLKAKIQTIFTVLALVGTIKAQSINVTPTGVGIGTTTPGFKLHVNGVPSVNADLKANLALEDPSGFAVGAGPGIVFRPKYNSGGAYWDAAGIKGIKENAADGNFAGALSFQTSPNGGSPTERVRIDSRGNLGIGVSNPNAKIEMYGANGQLTAALADGGERSASLALNVNTGDAGSGAAITFGNQQSNLAGSIGYAAIKGLLTNGGARTVGDLAFSTRNATSDIALTECMRITSVGNVGIGTPNPSQKLEVFGSVKATNFISATKTYADFIFAPEYQLPSLDSVEAHIKAHQHLPGVPSEKEVMADGINLGDMQVKLLAQIEQLTLHVIELNKKSRAQAEEIRKLQAQATRN